MLGLSCFKIRGKSTRLQGQAYDDTCGDRSLGSQFLDTWATAWFRTQYLIDGFLIGSRTSLGLRQLRWIRMTWLMVLANHIYIGISGFSRTLKICSCIKMAGVDVWLKYPDIWQGYDYEISVLCAQRSTRTGKVAMLKLIK